MALEAEQGLRINESDLRSAELGQESEASSATLALGQNSQAPQDTVLELQGDTQALQESNSKCEELMKENWQLREQVAKLGIQLQMEKNTNEYLRSVQEDLEGEQEYTFNIIENQKQEWAEEKQLEELGEQEKQLTEVQEALLWEQETNALVTQENERLQQEVARLTSWTEQLQAGQEKLLTKIEDLQASLENERENFQIFQNMYYKMMEEQRSKEISLPQLSAQCESLTHLTKDLEEERRQLWGEIDAVKQLSKTLLEEHAGSWPQNKGSLKKVRTGNAEEEEDEDLTKEAKEAKDPAAEIGSLKPVPPGNAEEEEDQDLMKVAKEAKEPAAEIGSLKPVPPGNAEEEEDEDLIKETKEAKETAAEIGSLKPVPPGNAEEEEDQDLMKVAKEAKEPAAEIGSLKPVPPGNAEEEEDEDLIKETKQVKETAAEIGSLKPVPPGNAEEEEDEDLTKEAKEAKEPAAEMRTRRSRLRAFLRFFQRQRHGSRGQAKSPAESAPGSPEATPAGSGRLEDRDTGSEPLPKGNSQLPDNLPRCLVRTTTLSLPLTTVGQQAQLPGEEGGLLQLCARRKTASPLRGAAEGGQDVKPGLRPAEAEAHPVHLRQPASQSLFLGRAGRHAAARPPAQLPAGASLNRFFSLASAWLLGARGLEA